MSISPFFRSPFTDLTGGLISHQMLGECQKEEARYMDCLEAYGLDRGRVKCHPLLHDFKECQTSLLQFKRFVAMRAEREKQISEGKLTGDKKYILNTPWCQHIFMSTLSTDMHNLRMVSHQLLGECANQEMEMMNCMEAYGLDRGKRKCHVQILDFNECQKSLLQFKRFVAMRKERERQIACGKLTGDKKYVSPRIDAY